MKKKRAVGLISGGLDSVLAMSLVKEEGFDIIGIHILTPFVSGFGKKTLRNLEKLAISTPFDLRIIETDSEYINLIKNPVYGYGKNINPCIDCHIYMLSKAKEIMEEEKADFIFTGEVLGQRNKSQTRESLNIIEKAVSLEGRILRPLSAKLLPTTWAESEGLLDRNKLLSIEGKTRTVQLSVAEEKKLTYYQSPAGGCLLTEEGFCRRLKDLMLYKPDASKNDYIFLQLGRHFRLSPRTKIIIPRDVSESEKMLKFLGSYKYTLSCPKVMDVICFIDGEVENEALEIFASYLVKVGMEIEINLNENFKNLIKKKICVKDKFEFRKYLL